MRRALTACCLVLAAALPGCTLLPGSGPPDPVPAARVAVPWPAGIDLPALRTVGDLPPPEESVYVWREGDGYVVSGAPTAYEDLTHVLAAAWRGDEPQMGSMPEVVTSGLSLVVVLDGEDRWGHAQWILQAAAAPPASYVRVFFAVRHVNDGLPGAFALFLPQDQGLMEPPGRVGWTRTVRVRQGEAESVPPGALLVALREEHAWGRARAVLLDADPATPVSLALGLLSAAREAGLEEAQVVGLPGPGPVPADAWRTGPAAVHVTVPGLDLAPRAPAPPPRPRLSGGHAGFMR